MGVDKIFKHLGFGSQDYKIGKLVNRVDSRAGLIVVHCIIHCALLSFIILVCL